LWKDGERIRGHVRVRRRCGHLMMVSDVVIGGVPISRRVGHNEGVLGMRIPSNQPPTHPSSHAHIQHTHTHTQTHTHTHTRTVSSISVKRRRNHKSLQNNSTHLHCEPGHRMSSRNSRLPPSPPLPAATPHPTRPPLDCLDPHRKKNLGHLAGMRPSGLGRLWAEHAETNEGHCAMQFWSAPHWQQKRPILNE
jgi:hypothetical protein